MANKHLIDTTPEFYIVKVSSGSEKGIIQSLIPNKVKLPEKLGEDLFNDFTERERNNVL